MIRKAMSWVSRILGKEQPTVFDRRGWSEFAQLQGPQYIRDISPNELVDLNTYRRDERKGACGGEDPLSILSAYAQDSLVYQNGKIMEAMPGAYGDTPHNERVNKFRQAYREGSPILLHRHLADILIDSAIDLKQSKGWTSVVFDGLRTMEAAYVMYHNAKPEWLRDGLLSTPGRSAHNRALAVDWMAFDAGGSEVEMGGHLDHADMKTNHRNYSGPGVSAEAAANRIARETAMQKAALKRGTVIAPLREEFWDDRVPGSQKDLWRVIESLCRCSGLKPPEERAEDYMTFLSQWNNLDQTALTRTFGAHALTPPAPEQILYHENLRPIYDRDLPQPMQQSLMDPARLPQQGKRGIAA